MTGGGTRRTAFGLATLVLSASVLTLTIEGFAVVWAALIVEAWMVATGQIGVQGAVHTFVPVLEFLSVHSPLILEVGRPGNDITDLSYIFGSYLAAGISVLALLVVAKELRRRFSLAE